MSDEHAVLRGMLAVLGLNANPRYTPGVKLDRLYIRGGDMPYWFVARCAGLSCDSKRAGEQLYFVTAGTNNYLTHSLRSTGVYAEEVVEVIVNYLNGRK